VFVGGNEGYYFRKVVRAIEEEGLSDDVRLFKELAHIDLPAAGKATAPARRCG